MSAVLDLEQAVENVIAHWQDEITKRYNTRVWGVVHHKEGDMLLTLGKGAIIERVTMAGWASRLATRDERIMMAHAIRDDRFALVIGRSLEQNVYRIWPGLTDNWSRKSADISIGGLGMISAINCSSP
ncbi:hypothetical protein [Nevskia ramosa]|uniref:hypothetical protein n=1 Tax=Nevskia ramosa TaxID=64002 RepID=UPI00235275C4|nr:hypothetical protein [Nevskia ramosa]